MRHALISAALLMTMAASPVFAQPYGMGAILTPGQREQLRRYWAGR